MAAGDTPQDEAPRALDASSSKARRTYAIGDVHGQFELFKTLTHLIANDQAARARACTQIVLLGNIVDLGPDSARMVRGCMNVTASTDRFVVVKGNHEDMMGEALRGDLTVYSNWLHFGGRKTLRDWGVAPEVADGPATQENLAIAADAVGADVIDWLVRLPLFCRFDAHLLVHAGIRPGIDLDKQDPDDLLRIRKEFLESNVSHGVVVVHGHTAERGGPAIHPNRIGINTDAHRTGRLTALGIENGEIWSFDTVPQETAREPDAAAGAPHHNASPSSSGKPSLGGFGDVQLDADLKTILAPLEWATVAGPHRNAGPRPEPASGQRPVAPSTLALVHGIGSPAIGDREAALEHIDAPARVGAKRHSARWIAGMLAAVAGGGVALGIVALGITALPVQRYGNASVTVPIIRPKTTAQPVVAFAVRSPVVPAANDHRGSADVDARRELRSGTIASRLVHPGKVRAHTSVGRGHPDPAPTGRAAAGDVDAAATAPEATGDSFGDAPLLNGTITTPGGSTPTDAYDKKRAERQARRDSIHAMRSLRRQ